MECDASGDVQDAVAQALGLCSGELDSCAAVVIALELGDQTGLVCEDRLEAMRVVVGEGELRAGVRGARA